MKKSKKIGLSLNKKIIAKLEAHRINAGIDKRKITNPCPSRLNVGRCATNHANCGEK